VAGQDFEDFDETTLTFAQTTLSVPMAKKVVSVADRYLIISYGITSLTHAIVYDMVQKRYGKLKIPHVDCFEYEYLDPALADAPRKSIAFLKSDAITLEEVILQNVHPTQSISVYDLQSVSGGTIESVTRVQGYETSMAGEVQRTYKFHKTGMNHSILLVGGFFLSSFVLAFHIHGRR
jgi:hypothetical protein